MTYFILLVTNSYYNLTRGFCRVMNYSYCVSNAWYTVEGGKWFFWKKRHMFGHAAIHKFSYNVWATSSFLDREGVTRIKFLTEDPPIFVSTV